MMKMMTARLEELSELYVEHRAYDPENERFNRGGNADTAGNLPWSTAHHLTMSDDPFSTEKETRMTALASELAPLCDRFGRTIVDLAPQLYRLSANEETEASDLEEQSPFHLLSRYRFVCTYKSPQDLDFSIYLFITGHSDEGDQLHPQHLQIEHIDKLLQVPPVETVHKELATTLTSTFTRF